eukprot:scaffold5.g819.t1
MRARLLALVALQRVSRMHGAHCHAAALLARVTEEYLASIQPSHRNPAAWFEMVAWYWHLAVAALVSLLTNTWTTDSLTETTATWRMLFFCAAGQAGGAVAALANHASSVLRNRPDNGWVHTCLANAECARVHGGILAMAARPSLPMRVLGLALQVALFFQFLPIYLLSPSVFHAYCGYRAEEQMFNYSQALKLIDTGRFRRWRGAHAPPLALSYYGLAPEASLRDALLRMRADEACIHHVDFTFASLTPGSRNPFVTTSALEKEDVYAAIVATLTLPLSAAPHFRLLARHFSVSESTLISIHSQEVQRRVIRTHHLLKRSAGDYLARYLAGADLLELCWELDLPPCIVLRRLLELLPFGLHREKVTRLLRSPGEVPALVSLEAVVQHAAELRLSPAGSSGAGGSGASGGSDGGGSRKASCTQQQKQSRGSDTVSLAGCEPPAPAATGGRTGPSSSSAAAAAAAAAEAPGAAAATHAAAGTGPLGEAAAAFQARLQRDIEACVACDGSYSPASDAGRRAAGLAYEARLAECLAAAGISYWTEDQLRLQGYHKTPDARLRVPVAVRGQLVNWVDSKATFGDEHMHRQQTAEQYERYVNRFGPGLVIYWHGYLVDIASGDESVLVLDDFPPASDITTLPCLPLSLAAWPQPQEARGAAAEGLCSGGGGGVVASAATAAQQQQQQHVMVEL